MNVGDGNLPEVESVSGDVVKCRLLFLFYTTSEGPDQLVRCNLDSKNAIRRVSEDPTVQSKDRRCG